MTTFKRLLYRTFGFLPLLLILWANAHWAEAIDSKSALFIDFPRLALLVKEQYVDPARISPDAMFASILESLEQHINRLVITLPKSLNEALEKSKKSENSLRPGEVRQSEKPQKKEEIILDMGGVKKIIPYEHLRSIWGMIFALKDVFNFVEMQAQKQGLLEKSINGEAPLDLQKINWDNFNSMLATLDPHSNFLGPVFARDITAATKGEFGGVGIVISVRDGFLTVISPIDGTPAAIAGVKSKDRIVKIEEESAVNLPLDKAVGMLRGAPNSTVKITVQRILPAGPKEFEFKLKRANIKIESVAYTLLDNNIGYLRIKAFQGNTAEDVKKAIIDMKTKSANKMSGIILDLRDNPGGLLREAVTIADYFLSSGEIVSTQGAQKESRQVEMATGGELDPKLKVAVLINGGSASASEIVAGAIKYGGPNANDPEAGRGILIGDSSSFGKGSVQMLFDFPSAAPKTKNEEPIEPGALKLTIAQYYGPGDRPIQANGIWPDIWYKLFNAKEPNIVRQEKDLDAHLVAASAPEEKPFTELVMLAPASRDEESEYSSKLDAAKLRKDPAIQIAMPVISSSAGATRKDMLAHARQVVDKIAQEEQKKIVSELKKEKIDWSLGKASMAKDALKFELISNDEAQAGEKLKITLAVKNTSTEPVYQVQALTHSKTDLFDQRELLFGKLNPGQEIQKSLEFDLPKDVITRKDLMTLELRDVAKEKLQEINVPLSIKGLKRPRLAHLVYIDDEKGGNGDGHVQEGEEVNLVVWLKNVGEGKAFEPTVLLKNESGSKIFLKTGRETAKELLPNQESSMKFSFRIKEPIDVANFEIQIFDGQMHDVWRDKIALPIETKKSPIKRLQKQVILKESKLMAKAEAKSQVRATIKDGLKAEMLGESGAYAFVKIANNLVGFVKKGDIKSEHKGPNPKADALPMYKIVYDKIPAKIDLKFASGPGFINKEDGEIIADISDAKKVSELLLFVNGKKVLYKQLKNNQDKDKISQKITLKPGVNVVSVVAKEDANFGQRENLTVFYEDKGLSLAVPKKDSAQLKAQE